MDAGVEGGSWDRIVKWKMPRVQAMCSYWQRNGPPLNVAVHVIGRALGIEWKTGPTMAKQAIDVPDAPSIAELAMTARPLAT